jgi:hypothetical protein
MVLICTSQRYLEFCVVSTRQENTLEDLDKDATNNNSSTGSFSAFTVVETQDSDCSSFASYDFRKISIPNANTVRRRLAEHDLRPRIPARGPQLLTAAHRRVRLLFTQNHVDWELDQWRLVMFSDESRFCLDQSDRRVRVNLCSGERYAQCNIIPKVNFGRGSVMV